jgi:hypothetical protein
MITGFIIGALILSAGAIGGFIFGGAAVQAANTTHHRDCADLTYNEMTMHKVYRACMDAGMTQNNAIDLVNSMQNSGVLFREKVQ